MRKLKQELEKLKKELAKEKMKNEKNMKEIAELKKKDEKGNKEMVNQRRENERLRRQNIELQIKVLEKTLTSLSSYQGTNISSFLSSYEGSFSFSKI